MIYLYNYHCALVDRYEADHIRTYGKPWKILPGWAPLQHQTGKSHTTTLHWASRNGQRCHDGGDVFLQNAVWVSQSQVCFRFCDAHLELQRALICWAVRWRLGDINSIRKTNKALQSLAIRDRAADPPARLEEACRSFRFGKSCFPGINRVLRKRQGRFCKVLHRPQSVASMRPNAFASGRIDRRHPSLLSMSTRIPRQYIRLLVLREVRTVQSTKFLRLHLLAFARTAPPTTDTTNDRTTCP